jgi:hypothetical protein
MNPSRERPDSRHVRSATKGGAARTSGAQLVEALRCSDPRCECHNDRWNRRKLHCPAHDDARPSLSLTETGNTVLLHCWAGCSQDAIIAALRRRGLWGETHRAVRNEPANRPPPAGLTLAQLAQAKKLPIETLRDWGVADQTYNGAPAVRIPYVNDTGNLTAVRYRLSLKTEPRFVWRKGDRVSLYGDLRHARRAGWALVVEGESDCWTCWVHVLPAVGMPGKSTWRGDWAKLFAGLDVYLWCEPDAWPALPLEIGRDIPALRVIRAPAECKDLSEAHIAGLDVAALVEDLRTRALPVSQIFHDQLQAELAELAERAAPVFAARDPLELTEAAIRGQGYGGDVQQALIVYLAATSRVLALRPGGMAVHTILLGPPSGGKSFTVSTVLRLLPEGAYRVIDSGSPRALIYDDADLQHRLLVFGEADSLPSGEDNPASSAVRGLLQDGRLHYMVTVRDPGTGDFTLREIDKPGPTVLITTAVRPLGAQLMTRLFSLEVADDASQVAAALRTQAAVELHGASAPDAALVAFQAYLQARAPWDVVVPFADRLAEAIARTACAPRILRDFARLLSLVKSVAVLRHHRREVDGDGRLIADLADYRTVRALVGPMYEASISDGAGNKVRTVVDAVSDLHRARRTGELVTLTKVSEATGLSKPAASRRIKTALAQGWLINAETRSGRPWALEPGEPMPETAGLPDLDEGSDCNAVTGLTGGNAFPPTEDGDRNAVTGLTGRNTLPPTPEDAGTRGLGVEHPPAPEGGCNAVTALTGRYTLPPTAGGDCNAVTALTGRDALPPTPAVQRELIEI